MELEIVNDDELVGSTFRYTPNDSNESIELTVTAIISQTPEHLLLLMGNGDTFTIKKSDKVTYH